MPRKHLECPHCGHDLRKGVLAKNITYDEVTVKRVKGGFEHKDYLEQGDCDPFPALLCKECLNDINEKPDAK